MTSYRTRRVQKPEGQQYMRMMMMGKRKRQNQAPELVEVVKNHQLVA